MRAAKESGRNLIHVVKAVRKGDRNDEPRSVLKAPAVADCAVCRSEAFETLPDMKRHFEAR
jgi:hypothetical protein